MLPQCLNIYKITSYSLAWLFIVIINYIRYKTNVLLHFTTTKRSNKKKIYQNEIIVQNQFVKTRRKTNVK